MIRRALSVLGRPIRRARDWGNTEVNVKRKHLAPPYILLAGFFTFTMWLVDYNNVERVQRAEELRDAETLEARTIACKRSNVQVLGFRTSQKLTLLSAGGYVSDNPDPQQQLKDVEAEIEATLPPDRLDRYRVLAMTVDATLSYRDCSPLGIEAFFAVTPIDPATGQ